MAAYAALTSLMNLIHQIHHHPQPPVTLDKEQTQSLTEKIVFLQDFLEAYNNHYSRQEVERLRIRIADVAYAAEDVIESHIVDQILASREQTTRADLNLKQRSVEGNIIVESTSTHDADKICSTYLYQGPLQKVLEEMDLVKKDVEEIKDKLGTQKQLQRIITTCGESPSTQGNTMVGFDDVLYELLDKLTGLSRDQIIPICGMGGIGKTTLAQNLYTHPLVEHHFDVLAWVTISQEYNIKEILLKTLLCQKDHGSRKSLSEMSEAQLGEKLYKSLCCKRYLIVMDDIWKNDVWDKIKLYFPRNNGRSRIIVTTRLSNVASYLNSGCVHKMDFLDDDKSWSLFRKTVFGEKDCPPELEEIGMEIARNCRGLPLSIVVVGGLLAKFKTSEYWAHILQNVSSIVNLEESERSLKILHTSYDELPVYLKACFLYMAIFPEDSKIRVSKLISMWVAEGFLKPISGKSLEESGEEYLMDLINRNLILVGKRGYFEKIVSCKIHDLLRELCIREARKERFVFSAKQHDHEGIDTQRRIVIDENISNKEYLQNLQSVSAARTLICYSDEALPKVERRLLRVFKSPTIYHKRNSRWVDTFNLRYFDGMYYHSQFPVFSTSVSLLWNLQTLIFDLSFCCPPLEIWKMPLLRHVECGRLTLPHPPSGQADEFVLRNLHTLTGVVNLKLDEEVVKRIPNVKRLELRYELASDYCLNNLVHLYKLENLSCWFRWGDLLRNIIFPHSLKVLGLFGMRISWEDINTKIGSLPHLQLLQMFPQSITTSEWETIEGQFCSLKYLRIADYRDWEYWNTKSSHFPRLERLVLDDLRRLREIPSDIGNITTLQSIELTSCTYSAIKSAKQIAEEQEEFGNEALRVTVTLLKSRLEKGDYEGVESLASDNFQVKIGL